MGVLIAAALAAYVLTPSTFGDDAHIALHSARVVLTGADLIFGTPALTGVTSPAYVGLLTVLLRMGWSASVDALRVSTALGIIAYISGLWALAGAAGVRGAWGRTAATVVGLASGFFGSMIVNATNGLETGWAMAALAWLIVAASSSQLWGVGILAGLVPCLRPDLAPAAALSLVFAIRQSDWRRRAATIALALAVAMPFAIWMHASTGDWYPSTMRAKQFMYAQGCLPWTVKGAILGDRLGLAVATMLPLPLGLLGLGLTRLGRVGVLSISLSLLAYFVALPGALTFDYCRYFFAIVGPWSFWGMATTASRFDSRTAATCLCGVALATTTSTAGIWLNRSSGPDELTTMAAWVDHNVPADAVLLVHDAGAISELAHRRAVDLVGLKSPSSVIAHQKWTWPTCGAERPLAIAAIARASHATYLVVREDWNRAFRLTDGLLEQRFRLELLRRPNFANGYWIYRMTDPDAASRETAGIFRGSGASFNLLRAEI